MRRSIIITLLLSTSAVCLLPSIASSRRMRIVRNITHVYVGNRQVKASYNRLIKWTKLAHVPAVCPSKHLAFVSRGNRSNMELRICLPQKNGAKGYAFQRTHVRLLATYQPSRTQNYMKVLKKKAKKGQKLTTERKQFIGDTTTVAQVSYNKDGLPYRLNFEPASFTLYEKMKRGFSQGRAPQSLPISISGRIRF